MLTVFTEGAEHTRAQHSDVIRPAVDLSPWKLLQLRLHCLIEMQTVENRLTRVDRLFPWKLNLDLCADICDSEESHQ